MTKTYSLIDPFDGHTLTCLTRASTRATARKLARAYCDAHTCTARLIETVKHSRNDLGQFTGLPEYEIKNANTDLYHGISLILQGVNRHRGIKPY